MHISLQADVCASVYTCECVVGDARTPANKVGVNARTHISISVGICLNY